MWIRHGRKTAISKRVMVSSSSIEEFANQEKARRAGLSFINGDLYLQFDFCPCPMLAAVDKLRKR